MKKDYLSTVIFWFVGIIFLLMWYFSPYGDILGRTYKNYYYSNDKKKCLTIIVYTGGNGIDLIKSCNPNYDFSKDIGRGIYIIPGKFKGRLPKENYVRLSYIGALNSKPIYYKWDKDTLALRLAQWKIIENKLSPEVKLDCITLDYEKGWIGNPETDEEVTLEWENMRKEYQHVTNGELRAY